MRIEIKKNDKAKVLAALYNNSKPIGMGITHFDAKQMTEKEAEDLLKVDTCFDYLKGRIMKIDLTGNIFDTWLYDRDNGENAVMNTLTEKSIYFNKLSD
jgi:hypothetical protein